MKNPKTKILIASVLKPVNDVRLYKKIGKTLLKNKNNEVKILGYPSPSLQNTTIDYHCWKAFNRLSRGRFGVQFQFWRQLKKYKPDIILLATFELLLVASIYKILYKTKIVYDIQEDYFRNLWYQKFYPPILKHIMAMGILVLEWMATPWVSFFILAEKKYLKEIVFVSSRNAIVIENKSLKIKRKRKNSVFKVLFSGTLSHYSQVCESIELYLKIKKDLPDSEMVVIGYAPNLSYFHKLKNLYDNKVKLHISQTPVSHHDIIHHIAEADLGIIGYETNRVNDFKIPSKLFEYTAARLPYLVRKNTHWAATGKAWGGAIAIDFHNPDTSYILEKLKEKSPYAEMGYLWQEEEARLLHAFNTINIKN